MTPTKLLIGALILRNSGVWSRGIRNGQRQRLTRPINNHGEDSDTTEPTEIISFLLLLETFPKCS